MVSRIELTGDPCWRQEHTFPNDEDIAGITLLSWDVDEADDVLFLQEQYKKRLWLKWQNCTMNLVIVYLANNTSVP